MDEKIESILDKYGHQPGQLVSILHDIQTELNWLPKEVLVKVSKDMGIPLTQVFSVVTFFKAFTLKPRGRHLVNVCLGTACHVRGAVKILDKIKLELGVEQGETTDDSRFTLETVNCVGACALGPIVVIDGEYHGQMRTDKISPTLREYG